MAPSPRVKRHCISTSSGIHVASVQATKKGNVEPGTCQKNTQLTRSRFFKAASLDTSVVDSDALVALRGYTPPTPMPKMKRQTAIDAYNVALDFFTTKMAEPTAPITQKKFVR